jgi:hypothetical protein
LTFSQHDTACQGVSKFGWQNQAALFIKARFVRAQ